MNGEVTGSQSHPAAALSYLLGLITGLFFLYVEPYSKDDFVRFHARQSIVFSIAVFVVEVIFGVFIAILPHGLGVVLASIEGLANLVFAIFWLYLMYKAYTGERYRIPELADWADSMGF
jgi:uncharacterized membrane protein